MGILDNLSNYTSCPSHHLHYFCVNQASLEYLFSLTTHITAYSIIVIILKQITLYFLLVYDWKMAGVDNSSSVTVQNVAQVGQKRPSSEQESARARFQKWKERKNTKKGKLNFNFSNEEDKIELFNKIKTIKSFMGDGKPTTVNTFEMLHRILDFF